MPNNENAPLIGSNEQNKPCSSLAQKLPFFKAVPDGMAKAYSTFGTFALVYDRGLWLLGPVIGGGMVSLSEPVIAQLRKNNPESTLLKVMEKASKVGNQIVLGYMEDFGFTWTTIVTLAIQFGGQQYLNQHFLGVIAPLASIIPAALIRYTRYKHADEKYSASKLAAIANTLQAGTASTFASNLLEQQGVIAPGSIIPSATILGASLIGLLAGLVKKSRPGMALVLNSLLEMILENPSLATAFFAVPNDIYAAENNNEIPDAFFFTTAGLTLIYLLFLTLATVKTRKHELDEINAPEQNNAQEDIALNQFHDIENGNLYIDWGSDDDEQEQEQEQEQIEAPVYQPQLFRSTSEPTLTTEREIPTHKRTASL